MNVFVYGGTGNVAGEVVEKLMQQGHTVYAGTRKPESQKKKENLHWVETDASRPNVGTEVLSKVEKMFLISPPGFTNQYEVLHPWIEKAMQYGVKKVVLMTAMGVDQAPPEAPFRKLEIELEQSGLDYTILRPNWFMQNFNSYWLGGILEQGKILFPGGDAKTSFIAVEDISSSAVAALTGQNSKNTSFALTGPEGLTHAQVASILTDVSGNSIGYHDISSEEFKKGLLLAGLSEDYADFMVMIAGALKAGYAGTITDSVKKLTGREPVSFKEYAKKNAGVWKKKVKQ